MSTGNEIFALSLRHLGEDYVLGALAPKNDADWNGPWDCAEFVSWCVFRASGILYGCQDDQADPAVADAYTGYWARDAASLGKKVSGAEAARTPGAAVLAFQQARGLLPDGEVGPQKAKALGIVLNSDLFKSNLWGEGQGLFL